MSSEQVAYVGLGNMGSHMAANLANSFKGDQPPLLVWNRSKQKTKEVEAKHIKPADSLQEVAQQSHIIVSCLGTDAAVISVWDQLLHHLKEGTLVLEQSTVDPSVHEYLAKKVAEKKAHFVAANIFGPVPLAKSAQLVLVLAGEEAQRKRAETLLVPAIAKGVIHLGEDTSLGSKMKLIGNGVVIGAMELCSQAITLADKTGVKGEHVREYFRLFFNTPSFMGYSEKMLNNSFIPAGFQLEGGLKDVNHIRKLAASVNVPCPTVDQAHEHMHTALSLGNKELDWSSLVMAQRMASGLKPHDRFAANDELPKDFGRHK